MERTKKEEKLIVTYFWIFLILLIAMIIIFFSYIYPKIKKVEQIKNETQYIYQDVARIQNQWMSYTEFRTSVSNSWLNNSNLENSDYLNEVVNSIFNIIIFSVLFPCRWASLKDMFNKNVRDSGTILGCFQFHKIEAIESISFN